MHIEFTLGGWILPVIVTILFFIIARRERHEYFPIYTMVSLVVTAVAWLVWIVTFVLGS